MDVRPHLPPAAPARPARANGVSQAPELPASQGRGQSVLSRAKEGALNLGGIRQSLAFATQLIAPWSLESSLLLCSTEVGLGACTREGNEMSLLNYDIWVEK